MHVDVFLLKRNPLNKRRKQEAQKLLSEAQKLDKQGMLTDQIKMMKQNMKQAVGPTQHYGAGASVRSQKRRGR